MADTQFARGNYTEAIDSYKSFAAAAPDAREGRGRLRRVPDRRELLQGHAGRHLDPAAVVREGSVGGERRRGASSTTSARSIPDSPYGKKADGAAQGGPEAPGRPRGLRGALLSQAATTPRRRRCGIEGAIKRYPGSGREPELLFSLGRDLPAHGRSAARQGDLHARGQRVRRGAAGPPVGALPRVHRQALRPEPAAQADRRRAPRPPMAEAAPTWTPATLRELVARGRAHYAAGEYAEADRLPDRGAARARPPTPTSTTCWASSTTSEGRLAEAEEMFQRGAAHQPGLHRGGAEPGGHLQRPRQVRARPRTIYEQAMAAVAARPARARSLRQGQDRQHARRGRRRLPRGRALRRRGARVRAGAGALPDVRRHPHRARQRRCARWASCRRRDPRARAGARRAPALRRRAAPPRASATTPPAGATTRRRSGGRCWKPTRATSRRRCTWRCCDGSPAGSGLPPGARPRRSSPTSEAAIVQASSIGPGADRRADLHPHARHVRSSRRSPPTPPRGEGDAHLPLDREARPDHVRRHRPRSRARFGVAARDVGYAGLKDRHALDPAVAERARRPIRSARWRLAGRRPHGAAAPPATAQAARSATCAAIGSRSCSPATGRRRARPRARATGCGRCAARPASPTATASSASAPAATTRRVGLALLRGERRERDQRRRRLLLSALQSAVFNRYLELRGRRRGRARRVRAGDVLQKTDSGGLFVSTDAGRRSGARRRGRGRADRAAAGRRARSSRRPTRAARALEDARHRRRRRHPRRLRARAAASCRARGARCCSP